MPVEADADEVVAVPRESERAMGVGDAGGRVGNLSGLSGAEKGA